MTNMIWHPLQVTCSQKHTDSSVDTSNTELKNDTEKTLTINKLDVCQKTSWVFVCKYWPNKVFCFDICWLKSSTDKYEGHIKSVWMPSLAIRFQLRRGLYTTKQTPSGSQMHVPRNHHKYSIVTFNVRKNHDLVFENVFTSSESSLAGFKEHFELTY